MIETYKVRFTDEERLYAGSLVKKVNFGNRKSGANGNFEMQYTGLLGEVVLADLLNIPRPNGLKPGYDDGIDFLIHGIAIDLKTMGRDFDYREKFVNNLICSQVDHWGNKANVYLFASINKKTRKMEFIGWIKKRTIQLGAKGVVVCKKGQVRTRADGTTFETRADMYEIPYSSLKPFTCPEGFLMDMGGLKYSCF